MSTPSAPPSAATATAGLLAATMLGAVLLARIAVVVQMHWSPVLIFPILVGVAAGLAVGWSAHVWLQLSRPAVLGAAMLAGFLLVAGQHVFAYRQYLANYEQSRLKNPQMQLLEQALSDLKPMQFIDFMHYSARGRFYGPWELGGASVWLSWALDGLLTVAAATLCAWCCWQRRPIETAGDDRATPPLQ